MVGATSSKSILVLYQNDLGQVTFCMHNVGCVITTTEAQSAEENHE